MIEVTTPIDAIITRVSKWALENLPYEYMNSSRMTYFKSAFRSGIITKDELENAKNYYGQLWNYVGD